MKWTLVSSVAIFLPAALAIPPANFGFPSSRNDTPLEVYYHVEAASNSSTEYVRVAPGAKYGIGIAARRPILAVDTTAYQSLANYTGRYLVAMVDPDASYPDQPNNRFILHWLQGNITQSDSVSVNNNLTVIGKRLINETAPVVPYRRPSPPTNSSAHRYIIYAWHQPANFAIPASFAGYSSDNRTRFNLTQWVIDARVGEPAAVNYFYTTNQSSIPANFIVGPNGTYPGGNGALIASGDPYRPTRTASTTGPTSSTSTGGAAMMTGMGSLVGAGLIGLAALL